MGVWGGLVVTAPALQGPSETFDVFLVLPFPSHPCLEWPVHLQGWGGAALTLSHLSLPLKAPEEVTLALCWQQCRCGAALAMETLTM